MPMDLKEFKDLPEAKVATTVEVTELLEELGRHAMTKAEIAEFLDVAPGTAYTKLRKLEASEHVERRKSGKHTFWAWTGKPYGPEEEE